MKQMAVEKQFIIDYNLDDENLPSSARDFQPTLYQDGDAYCCILGPDPQAGIFGCGDTPQLALQDWDKHFQDLLAGHYSASEETKNYITDTLRTSKKDVW